MNIPKKPYYWTYSVDVDRGEGITEAVQAASSDDDLAAAISQAHTAAFHYVAIGYSNVQVTLQAACAKCSGWGDIAVPMKTIVGRRKTCSDCKGIGRYPDAYIGPIQVKSGEHNKIVEKEQVIEIVVDPKWGIPLEKGDEVIVRSEKDKPDWIVRSWPERELLGIIGDAMWEKARHAGAIKIKYY